MNVLLSAYACEPGKGSEPGVGWKWTMGLAGRVTLCVLTRESNRAAIECALNEAGADSPLRLVRFEYHDLSKPFLRLKRWKLLPTMAYYFLWQWAAARRFGELADRQDIVHHLTFCTLLCPGFWKLRQAAFVVGPVGAPLVCPHYYPLFGRQASVQRLRGWVMNRFLRLPWLKRMLSGAAAVVPANSETKALLLRHGISAQEIMLDTGAPETPINSPATRNIKAGNRCRFLYAGRIERRKGLELALRAFDIVRREGAENWEFIILGEGPDRPRLETLARDMQLTGQIHFLNPVPHHEVQDHFRNADVFLFTSVRDTSGGVNLEAMAAGLPVLCIAHQGVADITDESCAIRIPPASVADTISALAAGIRKFTTQPDLLVSLSKAAKLRAHNHFSWGAKFDRMVEVYREILQSR